MNPRDRAIAPAPPGSLESGPNLDFRQRLLDGLARAIRERGLRGTQIGDIVRNARTSKRTFYECFEDKEACFAELIDEWGQEILAIVQAAADPEAPWDRQIDLTVDAYLGALAEDPALTITVTRDLPSLGARGVELQERDIGRYTTLMMEMTRGPVMRKARVEPVEPETAVMLIGGVAEVLDRATREGKSPTSVAATVKKVMKLVIGPR